MSQEKVNKYKEQKAHRKEIMAKEKRHNNMMKAVAALVVVVCLGWIGYSVYGVATRPDTSSADVNLDAYYEYQESLYAEE